MADASDGSIVIDTRIDNSGAKVGMKKLESMIDSLRRKTRGVGDSMQHSASSAVSATREAANGYAHAAQSAAQAAKAIKQYDAALERNQRQINVAKGKLSEYYAEVERIKAATDEALKQTTTDEQAAHLLEIEEIELQNVNEKYAAQLDLLKNLEAEHQRLAAARSAAASVQEEPTATPNNEIVSAWDRLGNVVSRAAHNVAAAARNLAVSGLRMVAQAAKEAAKGLIKLTAKSIVNGVKRLGGWLSGAARSLLLFGRSNKKLNGGLGMSLKTMLKYGLGIRSLYVLFNRLRAAIKEGFGNLAQYSNAVNQSISSVLSSLTKLKNQIAAAFAPLVEIAAPVLKNLVDGLTNASVKLAQLISALTGKSTFVKAKDVQEDYAESLKNTADEAKEAKKQLAGFDELEILKKDSAKDDNKTAPEDMFEEVEIPKEVQDIADDIRDVLEDEDWTPIGQTIGEKIKKALGDIDWESIKQKAWELGKKLATLLNGILETPGLFYDLGKTLAEAINTAFSFVDGFAWNFHWDSLGTAIMDAIEGVCDNLDWKLINHAVQGVASGLADFINSVFSRKGVFEKVGETIGKAINTVVDAGLTLLDKTNFKQAAESIVAGLNNAVKTIRWDKIGELIGKGFGSALEFLHTAITDFDWAGLASGIASGINAFVSALREKIAGLDWKKLGLSLATGLNHLLLETNWSEVGAAVSDIIKDLLDMVFSFLANVNWQALGEAIADLILGIDWAGIAGRLFQIGIMLIAGLFQGMIAFMAKIGQWLKEHIVDPIVEGLEKLFGINSPSRVMAEIGGYLIEGLLKGIKDGAANIGKFIKNKIVQPIQKFFKDPIGTIKLAVDDTWTATQKVWESVKDSEAVKTIVGNITQSFDRAQETFDSFKNGTVVKTIGGFVEKSFETARDTFNAFKDGSVFKHVQGRIEKAFDDAKQTFTAFVDGDVFKHVQGSVEKAYNDAKDTFDAFRDTNVFKFVMGSVETPFIDAKSTFDAFKDGNVIKHIEGTVEKTFSDAKTTFEAFKNGDVFKQVQGRIEQAFTDAKSTFEAFKNGDVFKQVQGRIEQAYTDAKSTFDTFKDADVFKQVKGNIVDTGANAFTTVKKTFDDFKDADVYKNVKAAVEKAGTWVAEAWTAAQMTASTVTHTVRSAVEKASSWVADAWTALSLAGQTFTTTVKAQVQQYATSGSYWVADAWTVLKTAGQTLNTTVKTALQQAATSGSNWVSDAWTAIKYGGQSVTATVKTALTKDSSYNWNADAWTALGSVGKTQVTTLQVDAQRKNNYGDVAKTWAALTSGGTISTTFQIGVNFLNSALQSVKNWLGLKAVGGILAGGSWRSIPQFAGGGIFRSLESGIRAYAGGTSRVHGSLFLAGEAGPEVVGHINGRTEVLNKSQIASAIYSAVLAGMETAVNGLGKYIATCMINCTNAIIAGMLAVTQITGAIPVQLVGEDATLMKQLSALTGNVTYTVPAFSTGSIMPYEIAALVERSTARLEGAINNLDEDLTQVIISTMGSAVSTLVSAIKQNNDAQNGFDTAGLLEEMISEINRRTVMYNKSPFLL